MPSSSSKATDIQWGLAQRVGAGLQEEIITGRLRPGDRLRRRDIAQRYGVSYAPVTEAMIRLEYTGLIEVGPSQTAVVRRMTLESIHSDYVLREAIEVQAIRLACKSATDAEIDDLSRLAAIVDKSVEGLLAGQNVETAKPEWMFHRRLAELSHYPVLVRELDRIALLDHFRVCLINAPPVASFPNQAHERLVQIIRTHDVQAADEEMRAHIHWGLANQCAAFVQSKLSES